MSLTVGTAIGAGQTWTIQNATSAVITSKPAWMTATGAVSGNDYVFTLTGTPDNSAASFTLSANADNNNVPAGCAPAVTGQSVTSASVIVNCITPVIGAWTPGAACTTPTIGTTLSPTTATVGSAYSATIAVSNCTTASVTNLPAWASQSYAQSGSNGTITITGTPAAGDVTAGLALTVDATNNPGGCTSASATGLAGGTLVVSASGGLVNNYFGTACMFDNGQDIAGVGSGFYFIPTWYEDGTGKINVQPMPVSSNYVYAVPGNGTCPAPTAGNPTLGPVGSGTTSTIYSFNWFTGGAPAAGAYKLTVTAHTQSAAGSPSNDPQWIDNSTTAGVTITAAGVGPAFLLEKFVSPGDPENWSMDITVKIEEIANPANNVTGTFTFTMDQ